MASGRTNRCSWLIPAVLLLLLTLAFAKPNSPSIRNDSETHESCGINMECVPRKLCQDGIINDDGFGIITPLSAQTKCSNPLHRCCRVKQKEEDTQT